MAGIAHDDVVENFDFEKLSGSNEVASDFDVRRGWCRITALERYGNTDEIASFVAFLASSEASYITGASLLADGGFAA